MLKAFLIFVIIVSAVSSLNAQPKSDHPARQLVEVENAFCKMAVEKGIKDAFLAYLADESIMFSPQPTNGKKLYASRPPSPALLVWEPVLADMAKSGDYGYTTGPWTFTLARTQGDTIRAYGYYVTFWIKQADGSWKANIDAGIDTGQANPADTTLALLSPHQFKVNKTSTLENEKNALRQMDDNYNTMIKEKGKGIAFQANASSEARLYRDNMLPVAGLEASLKALAELTPTREPISFESMASFSAPSMDLGYTYGVIHWPKVEDDPQTPTETGYVRFWKKQADGSWKIVLDLM